LIPHRASGRSPDDCRSALQRERLTPTPSPCLCVSVARRTENRVGRRGLYRISRVGLKWALAGELRLPRLPGNDSAGDATGNERSPTEVQA